MKKTDISMKAAIAEVESFLQKHYRNTVLIQNKFSNAAFWQFRVDNVVFPPINIMLSKSESNLAISISMTYRRTDLSASLFYKNRSQLHEFLLDTVSDYIYIVNTTMKLESISESLHDLANRYKSTKV